MIKNSVIPFIIGMILCPILAAYEPQFVIPDATIDQNFKNAAAELKAVSEDLDTAEASIATATSTLAGAALLNSTQTFTGQNTFSGIATFSNTGGIVISTFSKTLNGFTYLPGGILMQWGYYPGGVNSPTITYPKTFPTGVFSISCTPEDPSSGGTNGLMGAIFSVTASKFVCEINRHDAAAGTGAFRWIAIGH